MSLSGTTRVVHRLEKEGFIRRVRCDQDGRSWYAALAWQGVDEVGEWAHDGLLVRIQ
jgi:DNA-binding MarR family transcriptional regulator